MVIMVWDKFGLLLSKDSSILWVKSRVCTLFIDNPVNVVTSGSVGLSTPGDFVRLVMLIIVPGMISL